MEHDHDKKTILSRATLMPLGFVGVILMAAITGIVKFTTLVNAVDGHEKHFTAIDQVSTDQQKKIDIINERTIRIETKIDAVLNTKAQTYASTR